jgi:hypothetical protein
LVIATVAVLCTSCGVNIKDKSFYVDLGPQGAVTVNFLTPGSRFVSKSNWDLLRMGMFCMSPKDLGSFKTEIEKLCSVTQCDYEMTSALHSFSDRLDLISRGAYDRSGVSVGSQ